MLMTHDQKSWQKSVDKSWPAFLSWHLMLHKQYFANFSSACDHKENDSSDDEVLATTVMLLYLRKRKKRIWTLWMRPCVLRRQLKIIVIEWLTQYFHFLPCLCVYLGLQSSNGKCTDHHINWQIYSDNLNHLDYMESD